MSSKNDQETKFKIRIRFFFVPMTNQHLRSKRKIKKYLCFERVRWAWNLALYFNINPPNNIECFFHFNKIINYRSKHFV